MKAKIFNIQKFCTHDGDGIRTTVFFAGCPLSCKWCHNPEGKSQRTDIIFHKNRCIGCRACTQLCDVQILDIERKIERERCRHCGKCADICPTGALEKSSYDADISDIFKTVCDDRAFYGDNGGVTVSGGEPLIQAEAVAELFRFCKAEGFTTAVETSCAYQRENIDKVAPYADMFLCDYKDSDAERLLENTGARLSQVEENIRYIDSLGIKIRLRAILIHGVNNTKEHAEKLKGFADSLANCIGIDIIKYHPYGESKYEELDFSDDFDSEEKIPTSEDVEMFEKILYNK